MTNIMPMTAELISAPSAFVIKKTGVPQRAPDPKHMSCRFVRLNSTFDLTFERSLGIEMYDAIAAPF